MPYRVYLLASTQHSPGPFPPTRGTGQELLNPNNQSRVLRALLVALDRWVREGINPPASRHPRLDQGTLVDAKSVAFPSIPAVHSPRDLKGGVRIANRFLARGAGPGTKLPLLVPQVDADGNELPGIRLPDIAVPLATYTGWNFRASSVGSPDRLYPLLGSYIPLSERDAGRACLARFHSASSDSGQSWPCLQDRRRCVLRRVRNGYRRGEGRIGCSNPIECSRLDRHPTHLAIGHRDSTSRAQEACGFWYRPR